jgi:hypothetical protein
MLIGTYNIDKTSFEHYIYDIQPQKMSYRIFNIKEDIDN